MSYKSIDLLCSECNHQWHDLVERDLVDSKHQCPDCGTMSGSRTISAPMVLQASYPDGYRRGGGYQELKEIAKLKKESADMKNSRRGEINKEITKLGGKIDT